MKREFIDPSTTTEADRALRLRKDLADAQARIRELEAEVARLRARPAQPPRHVERCAQAKLNRRLFQENERLKQEAHQWRISSR